jgi:hypothetical protein
MLRNTLIYVGSAGGRVVRIQAARLPHIGGRLRSNTRNNSLTPVASDETI